MAHERGAVSHAFLIQASSTVVSRVAERCHIEIKGRTSAITRAILSYREYLPPRSARERWPYLVPSVESSLQARGQAAFL
ncbi:uncharacterized protein PHACADRAFT_258923 [Phanerochaete carnosa HHB-10118-sp]|uniref:Uncharacterized protein n=1 Tax=Phanerochaete carnosa (strain HHB-10118-sp) TaxID=650164 RepID=K5VTK4_PHACS|nr:uncharacterized protein PHACADRAFT_258923 [Phanerochaete carnosa HHB-10118-sp]EKM54808.1 hypothetical protein PHACADRAFT_258923 [Phanerochaete carnosa HHB-10118-sp]